MSITDKHKILSNEMQDVEYHFITPYSKDLRKRLADCFIYVNVNQNLKEDELVILSNLKPTYSNNIFRIPDKTVLISTIEEELNKLYDLVEGYVKGCEMMDFISEYKKSEKFYELYTLYPEHKKHSEEYFKLLHEVVKFRCLVLGEHILGEPFISHFSELGFCKD